MTDARPPVPAAADVTVDAGRLAQAEAIVADEEGAASRHRGGLGHLTAAPLVAMSLFHLYAALAAGVQKWLLRACNEVERCILIVCGLLLAYPAEIAAWIGLVGVLSLFAWQFLRPRAPTI